MLRMNYEQYFTHINQSDCRYYLLAKNNSILSCLIFKQRSFKFLDLSWQNEVKTRLALGFGVWNSW